MGRKKIQIRAIADEKSRLVTFAKRKNGLFKKAYELSVLCECEIALIVFTRSGRLHQYASTTMEHALFRRDAHPNANEFSNNEDIQKSLRKRSWDSALSGTTETVHRNSTKSHDVSVNDSDGVNVTNSRFSKASHNISTKRRPSSKLPLVKSRASLTCVTPSLTSFKLASQVVPVYSCVFPTGESTKVSSPGLLFGASTQSVQQTDQPSVSASTFIAPSFDGAPLAPDPLSSANVPSVCYPLALTAQPQTESSEQFVTVHGTCIPNMHNLPTSTMILRYAVLERAPTDTAGSSCEQSSNLAGGSIGLTDHLTDENVNISNALENLNDSKPSSTFANGLSVRVLPSSHLDGPEVHCDIESDVSRATRHSSCEPPGCLQSSVSSQKIGPAEPSVTQTSVENSTIPPCTAHSPSADRDVSALPSRCSFRQRRYPRLSLLNVTPVNSLQDPNTPSYGIPLMLLPTPEVESELKSLEASSDCGGSLKSMDSSGLNGPIDLSSPVSCSLYPLFDPFSCVVVNRSHIKKADSPLHRAVEESPTDLSLSELVQSIY